MVNISIEVNEQGQVKFESNILHDPVRLVGMLEFAKNLVLNSQPQPNRSIQPAPASALDALHKSY